MSQQSTLKMMLPFFERWMTEFPTVDSLAGATDDDVVKFWQGLGYYSRARNILRAAKEISRARNFPSQPEALQKIPGIGPYTAAAISAIAFDHPIVPVDGNVIRVLARIFLIPDPLNEPADLTKVRDLATGLAAYVAPGARSAFAQGLMELGALVCRPGALADCARCPVRHLCAAYAADRVAQIPRKKSRPEMQKITRLLLLYRNDEGDLLLRQRPKELSLGGQWEIPYLDLRENDAWVERDLARHFEVRPGFRHTIMNSIYRVWLLETGRVGEPFAGHQFLPALDRRPPLTSITVKALSALAKATSAA